MKDKFFNLLDRIYDLVIKLLSVKGVIFINATILMADGKLEPWIWGFFAAGFVGIRTIEKFISALPGKNDTIISSAN